MNIQSVSVCTMYSYFTKFNLKICEKRTGMEPETELFKATIVGTEVVLCCTSMYLCSSTVYADVM